MTLSRGDMHSFIVRIWREPREIEGSAPEWRGTIEHVSSGQRRYFNNLDEIAAFVSPYLVQMGVELKLRWRVSRWLKWW